MPTDRFGEPWPDPTYRGFSGPEAPRRRGFAPPRISRRSLAIGAGAAIALGLVVGLWARPNLGAGRDVDAAEHSATPVPIEVSRPPPPPPMASNGKLEVLSPDVAAANRVAPPAAMAPAPAPGEVAMPTLAPPPPAPPAILRGAPPSSSMADSPAPPRARVGGCDGAASAADQMVCGDPELAAADREMRRAYRRAVDAGVAPGALRADQRDWMSIREDAARHSRRALADVYRQRIDELNAAAADGGGPEDDPGA